jgi:hypothetical protein
MASRSKENLARHPVEFSYKTTIIAENGTRWGDLTAIFSYLCVEMKSFVYRIKTRNKTTTRVFSHVVYDLNSTCCFLSAVAVVFVYISQL